jgi:PAS domain S-box-containing protein
MTGSVRVNLHCHSDLSDGQLSPEQVARLLAQDGVRFAALTDHDTIAGLARFREACGREGIGVIAGVELFAATRFGEVHLLAYGFDPEAAELRAILAPAPQGGRAALATAAKLPAPAARVPTAEEVCGIVHRAGGRVFLAHPLELERDRDRLGAALLELRAAGLDGIEAVYAPYGVDETEMLLGLARDCDLLVCGGTDLHGPDVPRLSATGVDLPRPLWERFREGLFSASARRAAPASPPPPQRSRARLERASFVLRVLLPALLAIALLAGTFSVFVFPAFEDALLGRKREMIRELTNSAWSILAEYLADEQAGRLTRAQAQAAAADRVRYLRYGAESKDYFWITDLHPRMIMHPYRSDLDGTDVSGFRDPKGNRVFMEFVRVVRERNEGYVEYVWQWKDDPARLVPKQSYVRGFPPWGWVIGTGIYVEDVHAEIASLMSRIMRVAGVAALVIALLLVFVLQQSFRIERRRGAAEAALRGSHDRYRALVEASKEGMMTVLDGRPTYANQTLLGLLGYSDGEWGLLDLEDIVVGVDGLPGAPAWLAAALEEGRTPEPVEASLRRKDGTTVAALLTVEPMSLPERRGLILIVRDLTSPHPRRAGSEDRPGRRTATAEPPSPLPSLNEPVRRFARALPSCDYRTGLARAAAIMARHDASALLVTGAEGEGIGLLADSDFCGRVVGRGLPVDRPVFEAMTAPLVTIAPTALGYEAIVLMREKNVGHLAVRDEQGAITGVIRSRDLLEPERYAPVLLARAIRDAGGVEELARHRDELPRLARGLVDAGTRPRGTCRAITAVADAITQRLLLLAAEELGPAPAPFAFIVLGSGGREEQTLGTDQDNAIIFDPPAGADPAAAQAYFAALGERVCDRLDRVGYPLCKGGMMAKNPRWCAPLAAWREHFSGWIHTAEPRDLLDFNTCFDFRCIHGDAGLAAALRRHVLAEIGRTPSFFANLAQNALHHRPLLGFFGKIVADSEAPGSERTFNVKEAAAPLVSFARLYALRDGATETGTFDRLARLEETGVLTPAGREEVEQAYEFLVSLRLAHQLESLGGGRPPTNHVGLKTLTPLEEAMLKQVFSQVAALQKRIAFDFLGGEWAQGA